MNSESEWISSIEKLDFLYRGFSWNFEILHETYIDIFKRLQGSEL